MRYLNDEKEQLVISAQTQDVADRAKVIYGGRLKVELESQHPNEYVAIEPESGDYFIAASFGAAVAASRLAHPDRISFVIHIGHQTAIHLGVLKT